jgi:regulator of extracellular matrix RemA (YlzA/DUF370 family)
MIKSSKLLNLGFGNFIPVDEVLAVLNPASKLIKKLVDKCRQEENIKDLKTGKQKGVFDLTNGKKVGSVIYCSYGRIYLSYLQHETVINNLSNK